MERWIVRIVAGPARGQSVIVEAEDAAGAMAAAVEGGRLPGVPVGYLVPGLPLTVEREAAALAREGVTDGGS